MPDTLAPLPASERPPTIRFDDKKHSYWIDDTAVPSVSAILELTTAKDALPWWGMRAGLAAVVRLVQDDAIKWPVIANEVYEEVLEGQPDKSRALYRGKGSNRKAKTYLEYHVQQAKLDVNAIKRKGGDRGTAIHDAIEELGTHEIIPDISTFPKEQRGYIQALAKWWIATQPEFHRQEVIVCSREHAYAGRFDLDCTMLGYGHCLTDFKTSKSIYDPQHFEQLRFYELADAETHQMADKTPVDYDGLAVVRLGLDGNYEIQLGDHVSRDTVRAAATLYHQRVADQGRKR